MSHSGGCLNIKISSYQYRDSHVKDKTVSPTIFSLTWESLYLGKMVFILKRGPGVMRSQAQPTEADPSYPSKHFHLVIQSLFNDYESSWSGLPMTSILQKCNK